MGLIYLAPQDALLLKLCPGEKLEHEAQTHTMGGGKLRLPRIIFMVSVIDTIETIAITEASKHVPRAVARNASSLVLRPLGSDVPGAVVLPLFPYAKAVGRIRQPMLLPSGQRVEVLCARSGRIVAFLIHDAKNALRPELVPPGIS